MKEKIILIVSIVAIFCTIASIAVFGAMYQPDTTEELPPENSVEADPEESDILDDTPAKSETEETDASVLNDSNNEQKLPAIPDDWKQYLENDQWKDLIDNDQWKDLIDNDQWKDLIENGDYSDLFPGLLPTPSPLPDESDEQLPVFDYEDLLKDFDWSQYEEEFEKYLEEWKDKMESDALPSFDEEIVLPVSSFEYDETTGAYYYTVSYQENSFAVNGTLIVSEDDFSFSVATVTVNDEVKEVNFTVNKTMVEEKIAELEAMLKAFCPIQEQAE